MLTIEKKDHESGNGSSSGLTIGNWSFNQEFAG